jgi:prolyl-tRNA editing enzyme YbaK/EbsC (Cys-tRNA(Pro) deacylase)
VATGELSASARKIQEALSAFGTQFEVVEMPGSTRTAAEAAAAIGCSVAQIAKSIVFRRLHDDAPVLVVASGVNRVDEARVASLAGGAVGLADAGFVRDRTGFAIGGVPPVGHARPLLTIVDEDLLALGEIWAAAGTPRSVFRLTAQGLLDMTGAKPAAVKAG